MSFKHAAAGLITLSFATSAQAKSIVEDWEENIPDYHGIYQQTDEVELRSVLNQSFNDGQVAEHGINFIRYTCKLRNQAAHDVRDKPVEGILDSFTPQDWEEIHGNVRSAIETQKPIGHINYAAIDKDGNLVPLNTGKAFDDFMTAIKDNTEDYRGMQDNNLGKVINAIRAACLDMS